MESTKNIKLGEQLNMFDLINKNFQDIPVGDKVEIKIVSYKEFKNLKLTHKQIQIIINSLKVYEKCVADSNIHNFHKDYRIEEAENISSFLEKIINYNYDAALNKSINRYAKKKKDDEEGMETFSWIK